MDIMFIINIMTNRLPISGLSQKLESCFVWQHPFDCKPFPSGLDQELARNVAKLIPFHCKPSASGSNQKQEWGFAKLLPFHYKPFPFYLDQNLKVGDTKQLPFCRNSFLLPFSYLGLVSAEPLQNFGPLSKSRACWLSSIGAVFSRTYDFKEY